MTFSRNIFSILQLATITWCCTLSQAHTHHVHDISQGEEDQHQLAKKNFLRGVSPPGVTTTGDSRSYTRPGEEKSMIWEGYWGNWMGRKEAPMLGYYACGAKTRNEADQGRGDDTGMNGLMMTFCHHNNWFSQHEDVVIEDSLWGTWQGDTVMCPNNHYIVGAKIQFEGDQGSHQDDSAVNGLGIYCMDLDTKNKTYVTVFEGDEGSWKEEVINDSKLVFGAEVRLEPEQGSHADDTAMNGLVFYYETPNDGISTDTPIGEWVNVASSNSHLVQKMTTSMTWQQGQSVTEEKTTSVTKAVSAGFEFKKFSSSFAYDKTTATSLASTMESSFSQEKTLELDVECDAPGDGAQIVLWQWRMYADSDENNLPGFSSLSNHFLCLKEDNVPQCPLGLCIGNTDCQECYDVPPEAGDDATKTALVE